MIAIRCSYTSNKGGECRTPNNENIQIIITSAQKVDNVILIQVWSKLPCRTIRD